MNHRSSGLIFCQKRSCIFGRDKTLRRFIHTEACADLLYPNSELIFIPLTKQNKSSCERMTHREEGKKGGADVESVKFTAERLTRVGCNFFFKFTILSELWVVFFFLTLEAGTSQCWASQHGGYISSPLRSHRYWYMVYIYLKTLFGGYLVKATHEHTHTYWCSRRGNTMITFLQCLDYWSLLREETEERRKRSERGGSLFLATNVLTSLHSVHLCFLPQHCISYSAT